MRRAFIFAHNSGQYVEFATRGLPKPRSQSGKITNSPLGLRSSDAGCAGLIVVCESHSLTWDAVADDAAFGPRFDPGASGINLERHFRLCGLGDRLETVKSISDQSPKSSCGPALSPICKDDSDTPKSRTGLGRGIFSSSKPTAMAASSFRLAIGESRDRLRVIISKSSNLTLRVTVRPRVSPDLQ